VRDTTGPGPGRPRPSVADLPAYRPGKSAEAVADEQGLADAIKLASNENPYPPVPSVLEAIVTAASGLNRYADHRAMALRARLADVLGVEEAMVAVGCGSVGLLQQLALCYVDAGSEVVYPWRSFEAYPVFTQLAGGRAVTTPLRHEAFDLDAVAAAVTDRTRLVLLANPNNPTGTAVPTAAVEALADAVGPGTLVVLDEAYREFVTDDAVDDPLPRLSQHPNLVVTRTFSKAHGLAGLRVGYLVAHPEVVATVDKALIPFAVNALAQAAALAALDAGDELEGRVALLRTERARVADAIGEAGWWAPDSQANFVWLPVGDAALGLTASLERRGVATRPFSGDGVRVSVGTPEENDRFLAGLPAAVSESGAEACWRRPGGS
jgi:histidinol-phosphate aminotransferase